VQWQRRRKHLIGRNALPTRVVYEPVFSLSIPVDSYQHPREPLRAVARERSPPQRTCECNQFTLNGPIL